MTENQVVFCGMNDLCSLINKNSISTSNKEKERENNGQKKKTDSKPSVLVFYLAIRINADPACYSVFLCLFYDLSWKLCQQAERTISK